MALLTRSRRCISLHSSLRRFFCSNKSESISESEFHVNLNKISGNIESKNFSFTESSTTLETRKDLPSVRTKSTYDEEANCPPGKLTSKRLEELFRLRSTSSTIWNTKKLAETFSVEESTLEEVFKYVSFPKILETENKKSYAERE